MNVLEQALALDKTQGKSTDPNEQFPIMQVFSYLEEAKAAGHVTTEEDAFKEFEIKAAQLLGAAEKLDYEGRYDNRIVKVYFTAAGPAFLKKLLI